MDYLHQRPIDKATADEGSVVVVSEGCTTTNKSIGPRRVQKSDTKSNLGAGADSSPIRSVGGSGCTSESEILSVGVLDQTDTHPKATTNQQPDDDEDQQSQIKQAEQSMSEMVLMTKKAAAAVADSRKGGIAVTTATAIGSPPPVIVEDPFARERQKRLLPSNTVSLNGAVGDGGGLDTAISSSKDKGPAKGAISEEEQRLLMGEQQLRTEEMCQTVIRDLNKYGVCVLDDFLGESRGNKVLQEVVTMYSEGKFKDGQLVTRTTSKSDEVRDLKHIRGDKISWIGGREPGCANIGYLINQVCF